VLGVKLNLWALIGGALGILGVALPWYTVAISASYLQGNSAMGISLYLYQTALSSQYALMFQVSWYNWVSLIFMLLASSLMLLGSMRTDGPSFINDNGKMLLLTGGVLFLLSVLVFPLGLLVDLSALRGLTLSLFSYTKVGDVSYTAYLTFGFWLAVAALFVAFTAARKHDDFAEEEEPEKEEPRPKPAPAPYGKQPAGRGGLPTGYPSSRR
jgi:hypothetical protein